MKILFVTSNRLGDAVLSTGLLDHLIRAHPDARITVVCGPVAEGVFASMPNRARTIVLEKRPYSRHWLPLWANVATTLWDLVVDIRGSALSWLVPTRRRAVMRRRPGHKTAQLAAILGIDPPPLPIAWTAPEDRARAAALLPEGQSFIALAPTANWAPKIWPAARFAALFQALSADLLPGARPAVFAGPGAQERAMAAPLLAALPQAVDLAGRLSVPEAAACLARTSLFIGNDSGLMHLAASAGTPTIGLFGPTDAAEYAPAGRRARAVTGSGLEMETIAVDCVARVAADLLTDTSGPDS
ncbi:MAG TPA: glycosyltransferase family 9 protein [Acetobacteraceae bacterium]|nr:glycosyltransferase family 9 protein [Acetobacteraceae bacterium]